MSLISSEFMMMIQKFEKSVKTYEYNFLKVNMLPECFMDDDTYHDIRHHLSYERNSKKEFHHKKINFYF